MCQRLVERRVISCCSETLLYGCGNVTSCAPKTNSTMENLRRDSMNAATLWCISGQYENHDTMYGKWELIPPILRFVEIVVERNAINLSQNFHIILFLSHMKCFKLEGRGQFTLTLYSRDNDGVFWLRVHCIHHESLYYCCILSGKEQLKPIRKHFYIVCLILSFK